MNSMQKTTGNKSLCKVFAAILLALCVLTSMPISAAAANDSSVNEKVKEISSSLMELDVYYVHDEKKEWINGGTGFLINENSLLTCNHVVNGISTEKAEDLTRKYGDWKKSDFLIEATVSNDVTIKATVKKSSAQLDFAILNLTEPIYGRKLAPLGDSDLVETTQKVYALGFPEGIVQNHNTVTYTPDDATITYGSVSKVTQQDNYDVIVHEAELNPGNSGGPLVDENGIVLGVNNAKDNLDNRTDSNNLYANKYAISINQIKDILDSLGINYESDSAPEPEPDPEPDSEPETPTTVVQTEPIPTTPLPTEAPVSEQNNDMTKWIIIAAIAVLVIILVVVVVLIVLKGNKKSKNNTSNSSTVRPPDMRSSGGQVPPISNNHMQNQTPGINRPVQNQAPPISNKPVNQFNGGAAPTAFNNDGVGATQVLDEGSNLTTVLGYQELASMVRKSNGEKVVINKPEFTIGKERRRVDYCITNNNSVSRRHAQIKCRAGKFYILDLGSTNFTYVNGVKLSPNQEIMLNKGDKIKISDEEFEFLG